MTAVSVQPTCRKSFPPEAASSFDHVAPNVRVLAVLNVDRSTAVS
jgi:hypothetical protein